MDHHALLIKNLQNSALYDHPIADFKVIETHISSVILTGAYAYKIKKPLNFQFLDFSTLAKRREYCYKELELNQRLAPDLYLAVVPISGCPTAPHLGGTNGPIIDYAIKMREFSQHALFSDLLTRGELTTELLDALALQIAQFHTQAPLVAAGSVLGTPEQVFAPVQQNFDQIRPLLKAESERTQLAWLESWAQATYANLKEKLAQRKAKGFIRECHGDIHLNNIILYQDAPLIFDCIEFNEAFRCTDVMADIGFITMDLADKNQNEAANRLINRYLTQTGDYDGLAVLPFYQAYRAMVRAKVARFRLQQPNLLPNEHAAIHQEYQNYINLAVRYAQPRQRFLAITCGISGSGKSTVAQMIANHFGAIHLQSDIERKRLFGLSPTDLSNSQLNQGIYTEAANQKTYQRLFELSQLILSANYPVVVDATFLQLANRNLAQELAKTASVPFLILNCYAADEAPKRVYLRQLRGNSISEATAEVVQIQQTHAEPLTFAEQIYVITINTTNVLAIDELINKINHYLTSVA